jgi:dTMP kinase
MREGIFITLEGPDGAGKTTQMEKIREFFEAQGRTVLLTREPGGTAISEKLREILLDRSNSEMSGITEMLIYAAARAQHVAEKIKPALERGEIVICDRFVDSSVAYQGYGRGLGDAVREVNRYALDGLEPDVTFFLDLDPAVGRARIGKDVQDRMEQENLTFHYKVYEGYCDICREEPNRVVRIDATGTIDEMQKEIRRHLQRICEISETGIKEDAGSGNDDDTDERASDEIDERMSKELSESTDDGLISNGFSKATGDGKDSKACRH